jgi:hypothetical protein
MREDSIAIRRHRMHLFIPAYVNIKGQSPESKLEQYKQTTNRSGDGSSPLFGLKR